MKKKINNKTNNEEKTLIIDLSDDKIDLIAEVLANKTCRQILSVIMKKPMTETEISEELKLPISTIHYNLQKMLRTGLITPVEFHYSEKGREVNHYAVTKDYIIIGTKQGIKEKINAKIRIITTIVSFITSTLLIKPILSVIDRIIRQLSPVTVIIKGTTEGIRGIKEEVGKKIMESGVQTTMTESALETTETAIGTAQPTNQTINTTIQQVTHYTIQTNPYITIGVFTALFIILFIILSLIIKKVIKHQIKHHSKRH